MAQIIALTRAYEPGDTVLVNLDLVTTVFSRDGGGARLFFGDPKSSVDVAESLADIYKRATE